MPCAPQGVRVKGFDDDDDDDDDDNLFLRNARNSLLHSFFVFDTVQSWK